MSKTENITFSQIVQTSYKVEETAPAHAEVKAALSEPASSRGKQFTTDLSSATRSAPTPIPVIFPDAEVSENYTAAPSNNALLEDEKREEELRQRFARTNQIISGLILYAQNEASEKSVSTSAKQSLADPSPEVKKQAFDMAGYMLAMMNAAITTMQNQATIGQNSTDMSMAMISLSKDLLKQAQDDLQKLLQDEYDASHRSFWDKLWSAFKSIVDIVVLPFSFLAVLGGKNVLDEYKTAFAQFCQDNGDSGGVFTYLVSALMILLSPFCGGTSLALMGVFMIAMQASGAQQEIDDAIKNSGCLGAQIAEQIAIALGEALVLGGLSGLIDSALGSSSKEAAEAAEIEMSNFAANAAEEVAEVGAAAGSARASLTTFLQDAVRVAFGETKGQILKSILGKTLMQTASGSLWSNVTRGAIDTWNTVFKKNIDANDEEEACAISGAIFAILAGIVGGYIDAAQGSKALTNKLSTKLGDQRFDQLKLTLTAMTSVFALEQSTYLILQGLKQFDLGETLKDLSITQGVQTLLSDMLDRLQAVTVNNNSSMNAKQQADNRVIGNMNEAFVEPWEIFG